VATIGLDRLYYAKITEDTNGDETYGAPQILAKAMTAELSVELIEAILYADDGASEIVKEFKSGALSLGVDDLASAVIQDLTGCKIDSNNVVVSRSEDGGSPVAIGFRAKKANGKYRHFWLYRVIFSIPATSLPQWFTSSHAGMKKDTLVLECLVSLLFLVFFTNSTSQSKKTFYSYLYTLNFDSFTQRFSTIHSIN
jgi:phi13 family phage major tail protein